MESPILEKLKNAEMADMLFLEHFVISFRFTAIAIAATPNDSKQVPNDSDFLIRAVNRTCFDGGAYVENPDFRVSMVDTGSGRLFNTDVFPHIVAVTGRGTQTFFLPEPRIISGGSAITMNLINDTGVIIDTLQIDVIGSKIFYNPNPRGGKYTLQDAVGYIR